MQDDRHPRDPTGRTTQDTRFRMARVQNVDSTRTQEPHEARERARVADRMRRASQVWHDEDLSIGHCGACDFQP